MQTQGSAQKSAAALNFIYDFSQIGIMKGVALPIEVLVIIVIAVIVLLGMVAVYFAGWTPFAETAGVDAVKNNACKKLAYDCSKDPKDVLVTDLDADQDENADSGTTWTWYDPPTVAGSTCGATSPADPADSNDNLAALCACFYDARTIEACRRLCGCI
jgi:Tfp pilus assembly protein PilW